MSAEEVGATAKNTFTAGPASPDDNSSSGCAALDDFQKAAKGSEKAKAGRTYNTADSKLTAEDDLSYVPGQAASLFKQLKSAAGSCSSLTAGGTSLALTTLPDPSVPGSDDTVAIQATGAVSGQPVTADIFLARFSDNVLGVNYGGAVAPSDASPVVSALLNQAAAKAQPVIKP